ncbi:MAG TPA: flagellar hook assembly protein FlgD [Aeromonadales bacterium]|nr:flagellar hook assembly protein FlgD [Aeromonadales bacterium]
MPINDIQGDIYSQLGLRSQAGASAESDRTSLGQDDFLKLMTQQLANQDPFKPLEDGQFIAQMAQFSSVDSLQKLENSFSDLSVALSSNQALQASTLVGNNVMVPADVVYVEDTGGASGLVGGLTAPVKDATLTITDQSGQIIKSISLGDINTTEANWAWDGTNEAGDHVASGVYQVAINGNQGGDNFQFQTLISAQVESVSLGGPDGVILNLVGLGPVNLADVSRIG